MTDKWAESVEIAAGRWDGKETEISLERWRQACLAKADTLPRSIRRRRRFRAWARRPVRNTVSWLYYRLGCDD